MVVSPVPPAASSDDAYDSLTIQVEWNGADAPTASDMATVYLNIQTVYEAVCEGAEIRLHDLVIEDTAHPNMSFSARGLGDAIRELTALLKAVPEILVGFALLGYWRQAVKARIEADTLESRARARAAAAQIAGYEAVTQATRAAISLPETEKQAKLKETLQPLMPDWIARSFFSVLPDFSVK